MTLPTEIIFPLNDDRLRSGNPEQIGEYVSELVTTLSSMYQDLAQNANGDIREFSPTLVGITTPGTGVYTNQTGWYLRKGLIVDYWFDLGWSAHTGTGAAYIQLPYKVKFTNDFPFQGQIYSSGITLTAGYTNLFITAVSNTFIGAILQVGSGLTHTNLIIPASGRLFGHIRYIGQEIEN